MIDPGSVVFRADASLTYGTGHVVRCLTLAQALLLRGWTTTLVSRELPSRMARSVASTMSIIEPPADLPIDDEPAYVAEHIPRPATLLVVDHYAVDETWHRRARVWASHSMAIDDLADRRLEVDLVLNQNLGASADRYRGLVPAGTQIIAGPSFALVRSEFTAARRRARSRSGRIDRILVFMSGSDQPNVTRRAVRAALTLPVQIDAVVGAAYPYLAELRALARGEPRLVVHVNTADMARLMERADLAVGAPGSASWERCTLGLPSVLVTLADNQSETASALARIGAAIVLGWHSSVMEDDIVRALIELRDDPEHVRSMGEAAAAATDGQGADRVAEVIDQLVARRTTTADDAAAGR